MLSGEHGKLPEKIIDSMIDIVWAKEKSEKKKRKRAIEKRIKKMIKKAEKDIHTKYSAKVDTLEVIKIHIKKGEKEEASALLRGFYLTRKFKRHRVKTTKKKEPDEVEDSVVEALEEQPEINVLQDLADLMSISEEEAKMYALELAEGFRKATKRTITAEKAAECYLQFRNWDFKNTWLSSIKGRK